MEQPYISVIVPAYNEAQSIEHTIDEIQKFFDDHDYTYEIIVSADGDDGTREIVGRRAEHDHHVRVIGSAERRGKGHGIREGMFLTTGSIVGFCDADYKTPIDELLKLLPWFDQGYDIAFGSRALSESHISRKQPLYRQIGSRAFGLVMRPLIGLQEVGDTQCGFKFFRGEVGRSLFRRQRIDGYMFDVEILQLAKRGGYKMREVGVDWHDDGDSRSDLVRGSWQIIRDLLTIRFGTRVRATREIVSDEASVIGD